MLQGSVFDCLVLEPEKFDERYFVDDPSVKLSSSSQKKFAEHINAGLSPEEAYLKSYAAKKITEAVKKKIDDILPTAKAYNEFFSKQGNRQLVPYNIYQAAKLQSDCLECDPYTGKYIQQIRKEGQIQKGVNFEYKGFKFRGKLDAYVANEYTVDLKKVRSSNHYKMKWNVRDQKLDIQAVLYKIGTDSWQDPYYLLCVDNDFQTSVIELSTGTIKAAQSRLNYYLEHFERCLITEDWNNSFNYYAPSGVYQI